MRILPASWRSKVTFTDKDRNRCTAPVGRKHICANPPLDYKPCFQKLFYTRSQAFRDFAVSIVGRNYRHPTPSDKAAKHLVSKPAVPAEFRFNRFAGQIAVGHPNDSSNAIAILVCSFAASAVHVSAELP
jgi:hypothetical protein